MGQSLPFFMEEVPDYEVRDGRMHICMGDMVIAMPIHVFLDGCELGKAAIVAWHRRQCGIDQKVVQLPQR
jgi:hypothetical protein